MSEENLFRLRVAYVKQGRLRYLGHLEVLRTIERIVRRAGLPYAVTQGFSPHMKISFTSALPVGTASVCEWYDVYLETYVPAKRALAALRKASPADLSPYAAGYVDLRAASLSAALTHAAYRATLELDDAREGGEQGVIPALLDVVARVDFGPALTVKDRSGGDEFTIAGLRAEAAAGRIAAVLGGADAFLGGEELEIQDKFHFFHGYAFLSFIWLIAFP